MLKLHGLILLPLPLRFGKATHPTKILVKNLAEVLPAKIVDFGEADEGGLKISKIPLAEKHGSYFNINKNSLYHAINKKKG